MHSCFRTTTFWWIPCWKTLWRRPAPPTGPHIEGLATNSSALLSRRGSRLGRSARLFAWICVTLLDLLFCTIKNNINPSILSHHTYINNFCCFLIYANPFPLLLQAYGKGSDLVSVSNKDEHGFLTRYLHENDPLPRKWYTAGYQKTPGFWENEGDKSSYQDMLEAILPDQPTTPQNNYLAYRLVLLSGLLVATIFVWNVDNLTFKVCTFFEHFTSLCSWNAYVLYIRPKIPSLFLH